MLNKLTGKEFELKTANCQDEARLDISANGFWVKGQKTYVDLRVFDLDAARYMNQSLKQYAKNEMEKKRHYNKSSTSRTRQFHSISVYDQWKHGP